MNNDKILIFGGTFNPVHLGHVNMALSALAEINAGRIIVIPTGIPPHKSDAEVAAPEHRMNMCRLAFLNSEKVEISDVEINREGRSYTYNTILELASIYRSGDFYFLCGEDMFLTAHTWREIEKLRKMITFCVVKRGGDESTLTHYLEHYIKNGKAIILNTPEMDISSTEIRRKVRDDEDVSYVVPESVAEYIRENDLYK